MTGMVLVLAGLACGDGGSSMGAATAPLVVDFEGDWVGTWEWPSGRVLEVRVWDGALEERVDGKRNVTYRFDIFPAGDGKLLVRYGPGGPTLPGIYRVDGRRVLVCFGERRPTGFKAAPDTSLLTLCPNAPRKP